jgi:hypothetical protein
MSAIDFGVISNSENVACYGVNAKPLPNAAESGILFEWEYSVCADLAVF